MSWIGNECSAWAFKWDRPRLLDGNDRTPGAAIVPAEAKIEIENERCCCWSCCLGCAPGFTSVFEVVLRDAAAEAAAPAASSVSISFSFSFFILIFILISMLILYHLILVGNRHHLTPPQGVTQDKRQDAPWSRPIGLAEAVPGWHTMPRWAPRVVSISK